MSEWKTLDEILPEIGRVAEAYPENWREKFEIRFSDDTTCSLYTGYDLSHRNRYRRKPRTMTYTVERPEPMLERPEVGQEYWLADPINRLWRTGWTWTNSPDDERAFNSGLVYAIEEEAIAAAKAMVGGE